MGLSKIHEATKSQFPKNIDGAQSSIDKWPIPPKKIGSQA
jgi:hypothetical protein